jgi:hypothetical protein
MQTDDRFQIKTLAEGQKISEPGFYNIPLSVHHSQCCDGIAITSSVLRKMELESPHSVWAFHELNENRWERETESDALRLGRAMAAYVEGGPEEVEAHFFVVPKDRPRKPTEAQLKAYTRGEATDAGMKSVEFWAKITADPRDAITEEQWELICNMGRALKDDPAAAAALGGNPEITMAWYDDRNDLWCLARPDQTSFSGMLSDYKKVSTQGRPLTEGLIDNKITSYRYDMQMAFASEAFQKLTGEWSDQVGLVFQSDKRPHHTILRAIEDEDLGIGMHCNIQQRRIFRECLDSGHWPRPGEHIGSYRRPAWQTEKYKEQMTLTGVAA